MQKGKFIYGENGFTIIELVFVLLIISILAAIAVPNFMGSEDTARTDAVNADLNLLAAAVKLYKIDHGKYPQALEAVTKVVNPYLSELPKDKFQENQDYQYGLLDGLPAVWSVGSNRVSENGGGDDIKKVIK